MDLAANDKDVHADFYNGEQDNFFLNDENVMLNLSVFTDFGDLYDDEDDS